MAAQIVPPRVPFVDPKSGTINREWFRYLLEQFNQLGGEAGLIPVASGGTGLETGTSGGVLYFSGPTTIESSDALDSNQIVFGGGAGNAPSTPLAGSAPRRILLSGGVGVLPAWSGYTMPSNAFQGDILYASANDVLQRLPKSTTATRSLTNTGPNNSPAWAQVDLTDGVTDILPLDNGGTESDLSATGGASQVLLQESAGAAVTVRQLTATDITSARLGASTYHTVQDIQNQFHSAGVITWSGLTDNGDGTINVAGGTGLIRATDSATAELKWMDWAANATLALTDNDENFIYVEYNSGTPQIAVATTQPASRHTAIMLAQIYRMGTDLHINTRVAMTVSDHAAAMALQMMEVMPYAHVSGAALSDPGTRNLLVTASVFWNGLNRFNLNAVDTSGAGTFNYYYRDGGGGWTEVASQTQINNTQYDDGSGSLATLTANRYGVHWIYLATDNDVHVIYGQGNYLQNQAQAVQPPASIPEELQTDSFLIGKIIIQKSDSAYFSIESAFSTVFTPQAVTVHNELSGLQGGADGEYYHMTSAEYTAKISQAQVAARVSMRA